MRGAGFTAGAIQVMALLACANTGTIEGRVVDVLDDTPAVGVELTIKGTQLKTTTGSDGNYRITGVVPGQQELTVGNGIYTALAPLTVTAGARSSVGAADIEVVPTPPGEGVFWRREGQFSRLRSFNGSEVHGTVGRDGRLFSLLIAKNDAPEEAFPSIPLGTTLLAYDADPEQYVGIFRVDRSSALLSMRIFAREQPVWLVPIRTAYASAEDSVSGVHLVHLDAGLGPTVWAVVRQSAGAGAEVSFFRARSASVSFELTSGTHAPGTPEYVKLRSKLVVFCQTEGAASSGCETGLPMLLGAVPASSSCDAPSLVVPTTPDRGTMLEFSTSQCGKWVKGFLTYDEGWRVDNVFMWEEPPEFRGDPDGE